jgi:hypothetical protein
MGDGMVCLLGLSLECSLSRAVGEGFSLERVYDLYAAALERKRDAFEAMARSLHRGASKSQREEIARLRSNPAGRQAISGMCLEVKSVKPWMEYRNCIHFAVAKMVLLAFERGPATLRIDV